MKSLETRAVTYALEVEIEADARTVWSSLVDDIDAWWLPDFHMVGEGSSVTLDPRAGGRLVESIEGGGSLLWYTVQMCVPGRSLHLLGSLFPEWGGPATTFLRLGLEERGGKTLLGIQDALLGHVEDGMVQSLQDGWNQLFREGLKGHAERR